MRSGGGLVRQVTLVVVACLCIVACAVGTPAPTSPPTHTPVPPATVLLTATSAPASASRPSPTPSPEPQAPDPRVAWLQSHAIAVRSVSPDDEDFSDLAPLNEVIGDSRIVLLGEQSHGDGTTFLAKTRLIKFLHQEMGYEVLAFESGLYDCWKAWQLLQGGKDSEDAVGAGVFAVWSQSAEFQPLITYLAQTLGTERPLEVAGVDCQVSGLASRTYLVDDLEAYLAGISAQAVDGEDWATFRGALRELIATNPEREDAPSPEDQEAFLQRLEELRAAIGARAEPGDRAATFWTQVLNNLAVQAELKWLVGPKPEHITELNPRDEQMGENLIWLAEAYYPGKRIVVWAATYHIARHIDEIRVDLYDGVSTMGQVAWGTLGSEMYALGFTAYEGQAGLWHRSSWTLQVPAEGSLEDLMYAAGLEYAIVDLRALPPGGEWLREELVSSPLGYTPMLANWTRILDGMMYTRLMAPSTAISGKVPPSEVAPPVPNLDFEEGMRHWVLGGSRPEDYQVSADGTVVHGGRQSGHIRSPMSGGFGTLARGVPAYGYRGKRVRLSAYVRTEDVWNWAGLWMRADAPAGSVLDNMSDRGIYGDTDWTRYEVVIDVPEDSTGLAFELLLHGGGRVWVDDLALGVVGQDVPTTTPKQP